MINKKIKDEVINEVNKAIKILRSEEYGNYGKRDSMLFIIGWLESKCSKEW